MKKTIITLAALASALFVNAQSPAGVPMNVYINEETTDIPAASAEMLSNRVRAAVTNSGMGATDDVTQFYLTARTSLLDKHVVPGSPTKYFNTSEITFMIVDALAQKVFSSYTVEVKGVGNSEQQAYTGSLREFKANNPKLLAFLKDSNRKILDYYDSQYPVLIKEAQALALVKKYDEALFVLGSVPQACKGYMEVITVATDIYQKYLDKESYKALAKARTIWNAKQDMDAAAEAGEYIAMIDPDSKYYGEAVALNNEIKERVKSDVNYYRKLESRDAGWSHDEKTKVVEALKQVGVAYGNNQKSNYYKSLW